MFNLLSNLAKAAVAVAVAPVAAVVDVVTLPVSATDPHGHPFKRTADALKRVGECVDEATKPERD